MRHPRALPIHLQTAPFTVAASDAEGVPRGRLRARDLSDPFRGVRIPIALLENADDDRKFTLLCDAYQAHLPATWFFSHATAARILGVPLPRRLERLEVHVSMPVPHQRPRGKWVRGHSAPQATVRRLNGRPVRAPAELWCELAPMLTLDQLIRAGDRMLSDNPFPLASHRQLAAAVKRHNTRPGARKLREALPLLRPRVWSPKETDVRLAMARAGLPEAANNEPIYDEHGRLVAIGDLVLKKFMTVVEYEGERWHRDERAVIDVDRFNKLSALGWTIVRIRKHHTTDDIVRMIRAALLLNGWQG